MMKLYEVHLVDKFVLDKYTRGVDMKINLKKNDYAAFISRFRLTITFYICFIYMRISRLTTRWIQRAVEAYSFETD
jgi:hypothetical protein